MIKENQCPITDEIFEKGYQILLQNLSQGKLITKKGSSFRQELVNILNSLVESYEFTPKEKFEIKQSVEIVLSQVPTDKKQNLCIADLMLNYSDHHINCNTVIDFKFFSQEKNREAEDRYWALRNLYWLELYKKEGIGNCYLILATDNPNMVFQEKYPEESADFDCRDNTEYKAGKMMEFKNENPYADRFSLQQDYQFKWEKINELYFLKIKL